MSAEERGHWLVRYWSSYDEGDQGGSEISPTMERAAIAFVERQDAANRLDPREFDEGSAVHVLVRRQNETAEDECRIAVTWDGQKYVAKPYRVRAELADKFTCIEDEKSAAEFRALDGSYSVVLENSCIQMMVDLARKNLPAEVGTSLYGTYSDDGHRASVTGLAPLTDDSRGGRFAFTRGARGLHEFFRKLFHASGGQVHYVGEWHSHPGGTATPSGTDDANQLAIARDPNTSCPECILVILAIGTTSTELGVYVYSTKRGRIVLKRA